MLRRLPVRDPGQLVALLHRYAAPDEPHSNTFSVQTYQLIREHNDVFSGLIAASYDPIHVRGEGFSVGHNKITRAGKLFHFEHDRC
jgi:hypothetical protein